MRRRISGPPAVLAAILPLVLLFSPAAAQKGTTEMGVDAQLTVISPEGGDNYLQLQLPMPMVRVGFMLSDNIALEPALGLVYANDLDGESFSNLNLFVNLLWHSAPLDERPVYAGGGVGLERFGDSNDAAHQFALGGRVGLKPALGDAGLFRLGAFVTHYLENEDDFIPGHTDFGVEAGFSLLLR